jgi:hypothetical protein
MAEETFTYSPNVQGMITGIKNMVAEMGNFGKSIANVGRIGEGMSKDMSGALGKIGGGAGMALLKFGMLTAGVMVAKEAIADYVTSLGKAHEASVKADKSIRSMVAAMGGGEGDVKRMTDGIGNMATTMKEQPEDLRKIANLIKPLAKDSSEWLRLTGAAADILAAGGEKGAAFLDKMAKRKRPITEEELRERASRKLGIAPEEIERRAALARGGVSGRQAARDAMKAVEMEKGSAAGAAASVFEKRTFEGLAQVGNIYYAMYRMIKRELVAEEAGRTFGEEIAAGKTRVNSDDYRDLFAARGKATMMGSQKRARVSKYRMNARR